MMGVKSLETGLNKKTAIIVKALYYLNKSQRNAILKLADRNIVRAICECILNVVSGNVKVSKNSLKRLKKHKHFLRELASPKKKPSWKKRKQILVQRGSGILPLIIPSVMSFLLTKIFEQNGTYA